MFTVYDHPADYPDDIVIRPWLVDGTSIKPGEATLAPSLEDARQDLAACGLYRVVRHPSDDPCIVETWL